MSICFDSSFNHFQNNPQSYVICFTDKTINGKKTTVITAEHKWNPLSFLWRHVFYRSAYRMENLIAKLESNKRPPCSKLGERFFKFLNSESWKAKYPSLHTKLQALIPKRVKFADSHESSSSSASSSLSDASTSQPIWQRTLLERLQNVIFKDTRLTESTMIGEEHICAMLYQELIAEDRRTDCAILIKPSNNEVFCPDFNIQCYKERFLILPVSVNNNTHHTVLVIDQKDKTYSYFDSLGGELPQEVLSEYQAKISSDLTNLSTCGTQQQDGWSCGYHAVENALNFVNDTIPSQPTPVTGQELYIKHAARFTMFALENGKDPYSFQDGRVNKRQKQQIRDALKELIQNTENHPLQQALSFLETEIREESTRERSLLNCREAYPQNDSVGRALLDQFLNAASFKSLLVQSTESNMETNQDVIQTQIKEFLELYHSKKINS